ncbi:MAG: hypothetical protein ACXADH_14325, partial [Candidatus Kariarchaeaceae archaeon]
IGLFFMGAGLLVGSFVREESLFGIEMSWKTSFTLIFIISAIGWGLVNVNSIVVVWEHSLDNGTGTGMYYGFSSAAAVLGPTFAGLLMGIIHIKMLFPFSIFFILVSSLLLFRVKTGEVGDRDLVVPTAGKMSTVTSKPTTEKARICGACGQKVSEKSAYCMECGTSFE